MNKDNDPLDNLFTEAKQQQEQIAATAELGVESRPKGQLADANQSDQAWLSALVRLCGAGAVAAFCLFGWVVAEHYQTPELAGLLIERWVLGI